MEQYKSTTFSLAELARSRHTDWKQIAVAAEMLCVRPTVLALFSINSQYVETAFLQNFAPASIEKPKVLLQLVNVPLIEYTLQWLAAADIEEVQLFLRKYFASGCCIGLHTDDMYKLGLLSAQSLVVGFVQVFVFCCAHADQIQTYLERSRWHKNRQTKVSVVTSTACLSAGEALRLVDQKDVIKSDFVLVSGDIVANADLKALVQEHKGRRQQDKSAIMTMVTKTTPFTLNV